MDFNLIQSATKALIDSGATDELFELMKNNREVAERMVNLGKVFLHYGGLPGRYNVAHSIFEGDFISHEELISLGLIYKKETLTNAINTLSNEETLYWLKENEFVLFPAMPKPMTLDEIFKINPRLFANPNFFGPSYISKKPPQETSLSGWIAIKKMTKEYKGDYSNHLYNIPFGLKWRKPPETEILWCEVLYMHIRKKSLYPYVLAGHFHTYYSIGASMTRGGIRLSLDGGAIDALAIYID